VEGTTYTVTELVAAVLVLGATLRLLGRATVIGPATRTRTGAWAQLLFGVALALFDGSRLPDHHRLAWDTALLLPSLLCLLLSACLFWRAFREPARAGRREPGPR